jgi:hypothetical protein
MTIVSILFWIGLNVNRVQSQQAAVSELSKLEVVIIYGHETELLSRGRFDPAPSRCVAALPPDAPKWLRQIVGDDYFQTVATISFQRIDLNEVKAAMPYLKQLASLREIQLWSHSCHNEGSRYSSARDLIVNELPGVKISGCGPGVPQEIARSEFVLEGEVNVDFQ